MSLDGFFKLIKNDKIIPPKAILTYKAKLLTNGKHIYIYIYIYIHIYIFI